MGLQFFQRFSMSHVLKMEGFMDVGEQIDIGFV